MCPNQAAGQTGHAAVLRLVTAGGPAVPSLEAETAVIPPGNDLLCDASHQDEVSD